MAFYLRASRRGHDFASTRRNSKTDVSTVGSYCNSTNAFSSVVVAVKD
jgi:hypothetical protein